MNNDDHSESNINPTPSIRQDSAIHEEEKKPQIEEESKDMGSGVYITALKDIGEERIEREKEVTLSNNELVVERTLLL